MDVTESNQYLTFALEDEVFALDIHKVREVLDFSSLTKVPSTPPYMRGVINLRGTVVPVVDMRVKLGMEGAETNVNTCIIIVEIAMADETLVVGAMADAVREVIDLDPGQIEPAPHIGASISNSFIKGMGKHDNGFIIILDIDAVMSAEVLVEVEPQEEALIAC